MIRGLLSERVWLPDVVSYQELTTEIETNRRMRKSKMYGNSTFNFAKTLDKLLQRMRDRFKSLPQGVLEIYLNQLCREMSLNSFIVPS